MKEGRRDAGISSEFNPNPYWNRMAIEDFDSFFGRQSELAELYGYILRGTSVSVVGERRIGKSSLLRALNFDEFREWSKTPESFRFVYLDGSYFTECAEESFLASLIDQIAEEIGAKLPPTRRESLWDLGDYARSRGIQTAVLIDEFDVIALNPKISGSSLFDFLRAFSQQYRIPLVMVSKDGSLDSLLHATAGSIGSPFWNIFTNVIYVGTLAPDDVRELITGPSTDFGRPFSEDEITQIQRLGGYHPFYLQIACYHAFQGRRGPMLDQAFAADARPQLEYLLRQLPPREAAALVAYVWRRIRPEEQVLFSLKKKGLLIGNEPTGLKVFSSLFEELLKSVESTGVQTRTATNMRSPFTQLSISREELE